MVPVARRVLLELSAALVAAAVLVHSLPLLALPDRASQAALVQTVSRGLAVVVEALPLPVTGLTEAALASACLLGKRFSIVAISQRVRAWYRETVQACGLAGRLASIRGLDEPLADIGTVQDEQGERLVRLAERCVDEDGADVIVLAGAPLAGLARSLGGRLPVPAVDGVSSAVRHAESLVALQPGRARRGSFAPPPLKPNRGLPPAIEALLQRR